MKTITPKTARPTPQQSRGWQDSEVEDSAASAMTAEQAQRWRQRHPQLPVSRVLGAQVLVGLLVTALAWLLTARPGVVWSAAYGAFVGVLPAALAARGMARWAALGLTPAAALVGFMLWELVKLVLAVGLLAAAPKFLGAPNWPALLISLVLTTKVYWVGVVLTQSNKRPGRTWAESEN